MDELKVKYNIFISCDFKNANIYEDYLKLCEHFDLTDKMAIIDVINDYPTNFNESLCENILNKINDSELFICIMTPKYNDEKQIFEISNNILLELGYAISQKKADNIYIFIEQNTEKEFNQIKPSLLMHTKYFKYSDINDIIEFIEKKQCDFINDSGSFYHKKQINDKYLLSLIKYDLIKILKSNLTTSNKIKKINNILDNYNHDDIFEIFFDYSDDYISNNQMDNLYIDYCFYQIYILDDWIYKNNNQKKILNFLNIFIHILFKKFGILKTKQINKNRKNFILLLFELLRSKKFYYKDFIKKIINESLKYSNHTDYEIYVYKLNGLYENILYDTKIDKNKQHFEDLIFNSKSNVYNNWCISYLDK